MFRCEKGRRYHARVLSPIMRRLLLGGDSPVRQRNVAFKGHFRLILPVVSSKQEMLSVLWIWEKNSPSTWFGPDAASLVMERYRVSGEQRVLRSGCFSSNFLLNFQVLKSVRLS